jgi:hypothetical protein
MRDPKIFLLSPARADGQRAKMLLNPRAEFPLAVRMREPGGAPMGEVFSFLSGLYFRGKLAYSRAFAVGAPGVSPALVITADRGLVSPDEPMRRDDLERSAEIDIAAGDERHRAPLRRDAVALAKALPESATVVLLGSIATGKYVDPLLETFGDRLLFPSEFVGRGDMSRGGLMLRCVREERQLAYVPVAGAVRHGARPPKLVRIE